MIFTKKSSTETGVLRRYKIYKYKNAQKLQQFPLLSFCASMLILFRHNFVKT